MFSVEAREASVPLCVQADKQLGVISESLLNSDKSAETSQALKLEKDGQCFTLSQLINGG